MNKTYFISGLVFVLILLAIIFSFKALAVSIFVEKEGVRLWTEQKLEAYKRCVATALPNASDDISKAGYSNYPDAFKATFRSCKNVSENF